MYLNINIDILYFNLETTPNHGVVSTMKLPRTPLPKIPSNNMDPNIPQERKVFIAIFNFQPVEDGDLELIMVTC